VKRLAVVGAALVFGSAPMLGGTGVAAPARAAQAAASNETVTANGTIHPIVPVAGAGGTGTTVVGVAHQDDDLLFVNPDLDRDLREGRCLRVIYLTAGDAGAGPSYYQSREYGVRQAYAYMAGTWNTWQVVPVTVHGRRLAVHRLWTMGAEPRVELVFLRLPDGYPKGGGTDTYGRQSLLKLFTGRIDRIHAVDGSASYTLKDLRRTLSALLVGYGADTVRTMDYHNTRLAYGLDTPMDHSDHAVTGRLFRAATLDARRTLPGLRLVSYQGYGIATRPANLTVKARARKEEALRHYAPHESGCSSIHCPPETGPLKGSFTTWAKRLYRRRDPEPAPGTLVSWIGSTKRPNTYDDTARCLTRDGKGRVRAAVCTGARSQRWVHTGGTLRGAAGRGKLAAGRCLVPRRTPRMGGCGDPARSWRITAHGQIRSGHRCLSQDDLLLPRPALRLRRCDHADPGQRWLTSSSG